MPFLAGEHVTIRGNLYGQVVRRTGTDYVIRMGGSNLTFTAPETDLTPIMSDRKVIAAAYPPPQFLSGAINQPTLAYPFSNEKGFESSTFWDTLRHGGIADGAVIGVSGSVFDIASGNLDACKQIISVDINSATVEAINALRKLLNALRGAGDIFRLERNWRTGEVRTRTKISKADFLKRCTAIFRNHHETVAEELLNYVEFSGSATASRKVLKQVEELERVCSGKLNYSCWFKEERVIEHISTLLGTGHVSILCGDMITPEMLAAIKKTLLFPVSIFNMSNAIDYITDAAALERLFKDLPAAAGAKVVTSSQSEGLAALAGSFMEPKVHEWKEFLELTQTLGFQKGIGHLAEGIGH